MDGLTTVSVKVDEQWPVFMLVGNEPAGPMVVSFEADPATRERWQSVIDAYEGVQAEIAERVAAVTGETYPYVR